MFRTPTVCAVILTFNSCSGVRNCIEAVKKQTRSPETTLVVDNHSEDKTAMFLDSIKNSVPHLVVIRTSENLGPAGGFHTGMKWAFDQGYDYLWLLDDDSVPEQRCLEILLDHLHAADAIAWPLNIDENGMKSRYGAWRGELIPREVIDRGGLPNKDLFWGVEDTEYFIGRLRERHHIRRIEVMEAVVHFKQANVRKTATWHYYYRSRNMVYYRLWVQSPRRIRKLMGRLVRLWGKAILKEDRKFKKTLYMGIGIYHGLLRHLGKTIDPAKE